jgi:hypothetical protein
VTRISWARSIVSQWMEPGVFKDLVGYIERGQERVNSS